MDLVRRVMWWGMAYGSIGCLWMAAEVKADLQGQPESADESVTVVYYDEAVSANASRAWPGGNPVDNTFTRVQGLDESPLADRN